MKLTRSEIEGGGMHGVAAGNVGLVPAIATPDAGLIHVDRAPFWFGLLSSARRGWRRRSWRLLRPLRQREVHSAEHDEDGKPVKACWLFAEHGHAPENTRRDSEVVEKREARGSHDPDRLEEQNVECGIYRHGGSQRPELR